MGSGRGDRNQYVISLDTAKLHLLQWGPVVVTGIRPVPPGAGGATNCFNGVRSW